MWTCIIIFISIGSFSLGILHERNRYLDSHPIQVSYSQEAVDLWNRYQNVSIEYQNFFASKSGSLVYPSGCTSGDRIKDENKVYFNTLEEALGEGYRVSDSC